MAGMKSHHLLSRREQEVLKDVILAYLLHGEPVSSRMIADQERLGLSAATIRNIMGELGEQGYLSQPHTSAGRVPTAAAYHLFIESLMQARTLPERERRYIEEALRSGAQDPEGLMASASHLLSELSHRVGVVVTPDRRDTVLKAIDFVPLAGLRVLCVVVSAAGFVDNRVIEVPEVLPREELIRISNYLTENFAGMTLRQIRDRLIRMMDEERAQVDRLMSLAIQMARQGLDSREGPEILVDGTEAVLTLPELSDVQRVRRLFETFADRARLVEILNQCIEGERVRVWIGEDSDLTSELDFSLVATTYGVGERRLGSLGIFGPSRMEYPRVIPLVHYLAQTLSEALSEAVTGSISRASDRAH